MAVKRWRGKWVVDFTTDDGQRVRRRSPVQTRRAAAAFEADLRGQVDAAGQDDSSTSMGCSDPPGTTLGEFAIDWLETYARVNNKRSEVVAKESILRVHLLPVFGNRHLHEIGARDVERYKAAKLRGDGGRRPLTAKTVNNHLSVLRKLLSTAVEWDLLHRLPTIRRLKAKPPGFDWLRPGESRRFLEAVERHYPQWSALFHVALRTGMRRGEIFALRWADVDLVTRTIRVEHSVYRGRLDTPKSGRRRVAPMTGALTQRLRDHRARTMLRSDFLFPGEDGGLTQHQDHVDRPLRGALKRAGLRRIRFHDLRHSFASQLVSAGRSLKEVQELLGHRDLQATMVYAHLAPERLRDAVEALEGLDDFDDLDTPISATSIS